MGLSNVVNASLNASEVLRGSRATSMVFIPKKSTPKPIRIAAISLGRFFLERSMINAAIPMMRGAKDEGFKRPIQELPEPEISPIRRI